MSKSRGTHWTSLLDEARTALQCGDNDQVVQLLEPLLQKEVGHDDAGSGQALALLVAAHRRRGKVDLAIAAGQAALQALAHSDPERVELLCDLTLCFLDLGLNDDALRHAVNAVECARVLDRADKLSWAYNRLGLAYANLGSYAEGEQHLLEALAFAEQSLPSVGQAMGEEMLFSCLNNLGFLVSRMCDDLRKRGDLERITAPARRGRAYSMRALDVARQGENVFVRVLAMANHAESLGLCEEIDEALALLEEAVAVATQHGHAMLANICDAAHGKLLARKGQYAEALVPLQRALDSLQNHYDAGVELDLREQLTLACQGLLLWKEALEHHVRLHDLKIKQIEDRANVGNRVLLNRMELELARHEAERARLAAERLRAEADLQRTQAAQLQKEAQLLGRLANEDPLTGLGNRREVERLLPDLIRSGLPLSLAIIDVDHFKRVNDTHGHSVGDEVLQKIALLLRSETRGTDIAARIGGEEFLVAFPGLRVAPAADICERLRATVQAFGWSAIVPGLEVSVSIGMVDMEEGRCLHDLLKLADKALYAAKQGGRNRVVISAATGFGPHPSGACV